MIVTQAPDRDNDIKMRPKSDMTVISAIADALGVSTSLTSLDLQSNNLDASAKAVITAANEERFNKLTNLFFDDWRLKKSIQKKVTSKYYIVVANVVKAKPAMCP
eukprot:CAMPEP_0119306504 /NCGR_PEP_ID=MMETSP1333-20130426/7248_1 /TAXON_ID=418940 /ORGANISM="Scyphosphaera apsteinii, Strain RCC1455" /LENGTH=104 /DNA_ID=CAMNT_0007309821 /DNA_START=22 /DNA_END=337 /DNA_ORIENTATION=+